MDIKKPKVLKKRKLVMFDTSCGEKNLLLIQYVGIVYRYIFLSINQKSCKCDKFILCFKKLFTIAV